MRILLQGPPWISMTTASDDFVKVSKLISLYSPADQTTWLCCPDNIREEPRNTSCSGPRCELGMDHPAVVTVSAPTCEESTTFYLSRARFAMNGVRKPCFVQNPPVNEHVQAL